MEQAIVQLGHSRGDWHGRGCPGLTMEQLAQVDFSQINFDEWVGLMAQSGTFRTDTSMDALTEGSNFVNSDGRQNSSDRNEDRFGGATDMREAVDDIKNSNIESNTDCNVFPRPAICDIGVNQ